MVQINCRPDVPENSYLVIGWLPNYRPMGLYHQARGAGSLVVEKGCRRYLRKGPEARQFLRFGFRFRFRYWWRAEAEDG